MSPEPMTGLAAFIKIWGLVCVVALCVVLSYIVVIAMATPRNAREWVVSLSSTLIASIGGGSALMIYFGLHSLIDSNAPNPFLGWATVGVIMFLCGLFGWFLVRLGFRTMESNEDTDLITLICIIKAAVMSDEQFRDDVLAKTDVKLAVVKETKIVVDAFENEDSILNNDNKKGSKNNEILNSELD